MAKTGAVCEPEPKNLTWIVLSFRTTTLRPAQRLDFGEEVEEGVDALAELGFDLLSGAFDEVHGDSGGVSVFEVDGCVADGGDLVGG